MKSVGALYPRRKIFFNERHREMEFIPRPHQKPMVDQILKLDRCGIFGFLGSGKTSACLEAISILKLFESDLKVLAIGTKRIASYVWREELEKFSNFSDLSLSEIVGTPKKRLKALSQNVDIHTINYENLPWLIEQVGDDWPWNMVIADESTRLKGFRLRKGSTKRAKALSKYAFSKVKRFVILTGTPVANGLEGLWGQCYFLDKGQRLGRTISAYRQRYFKIPHPNAKWVVPLPYSTEQVTEKIKDICISIRAEDWLDLRDPIVEDVYAYLPDKALKVYKEFEKEMYVRLKDCEFEALTALTKSMKCAQLASGAAYWEDDDENQKYEVIHDAKMDALDDIIEEWDGENILVAYHFKSSIERLLKRYPKARVLKKDQDIKDWNKGKIPLMFIHPASAGHGVSLQHGGRILVFFECSWDAELRQQVIERLGPVRQMQSGYDRAFYLYNILTKHTIDSAILEKHHTKKTMQEILLENSKKVG